MANDHHSTAAHAATVHHEETDVNIRAILLFAAGLIVTTVALSGVVWILYRYLDARESRQAQVEYPLAAQQEQRLPPEPRLQTNPREDMRELREQEEQVLKTYGWVDRNGGVVRIPIDEAMKLMVQRGLPSRTGKP
jgi:hypothetical protein